MEKILKITLFAIPAICLSVAGCAANPAPQSAAAATACQPAPCATLNANELSIVAPLVQQQRDQAAAVAKAANDLLQDAQAQVNKQIEAAKAKK